jgi:hypothetical protein
MLHIIGKLVSRGIRDGRADIAALPIGDCHLGFGQGPNSSSHEFASADAIPPCPSPTLYNIAGGCDSGKTLERVCLYHLPKRAIRDFAT